MLKSFLRLIFFIVLLATAQKAEAQLIYFSDAFGKLFTLDVSSGDCVVNQVGQLQYDGANFTAADIAFHPNGKLYTTDGYSLYEVNLATQIVTYIGPHNLTGGEFINALVSNGDGVLYGADNQLYSINVNTGNATSLGLLPCESSGDLAYNGNELYLACVDNDLLRVNIVDPSMSVLVGNMAANSLFFGIVTFSVECSEVQTFGTAGNELYSIDVTNAASSLVCELVGSNIVYGASMETDFLASDCYAVVDLDLNNSSGAIIYDFFADTLCGTASSSIADIDVDVLAQGEIDSMVIEISAGQVDGNAEQLVLAGANNLQVVGSGTNRMSLINTGGVLETDLESALADIVYLNTAMPFTTGIREVTVILYIEGNNQSPVATAFVLLLGGQNFSIDLGPDDSYCLGDTVALDAFYSYGVLYQWNNTTTESMLTVATSGNYSVTVTDDCGVTATDDIFLDFIPPIQALDLGADTILCVGESLDLDATLIDGTNYEWEDGFPNAVRTVTNTGLYMVSVTSGCGVQTKEIFVEFEEVPNGFLFPEDTLVCFGETLLLDATLAGAISYQWQDTSEEPTFLVNESGNYQVTITFECTEYTDEVAVTYVDNELTLDLGADTTYCRVDSVVLNAYSPDAITYLWQDGSTTQNLVVKTSGTYSVTISDDCTTISDQVSVVLSECCDIFVPNIFSPNFDGKNDLFKSFSYCSFPDFELTVFNRWGAVVYSAENQEMGWDGQYKSKDAAQGVYLWVMKYNDGQETLILKGGVTLVR